MWVCSCDSEKHHRPVICPVFHLFTPQLTPGSLENDGGYVMLILGYDDTDSENRYWTVLNSWGSSANRPNALFRLNMDIDYSLQNPDGVNSYEFYILNVTYPENFLSSPGNFFLNPCGTTICCI